MLHTVEGNFVVYQEIAQWCLLNDVEVTFVVRMLDRTLEGDESLSPIYIRYIPVEEAASGAIRHTVDDLKQTRIIGPLLIDVVSELELFRLRYLGLYGITAYLG